MTHIQMTTIEEHDFTFLTSQTKVWEAGTKLSNLRTMCSLCNQGAKNITPAPPSRLQLMAILRRANRDDQLSALEWLKSRYD